MTATVEGHPPLSALWAMALSQASAAARTSVSAHLSTCDTCRRRFGELSSDIALLTLALEPSPLPTLLRDSILQAAGEIHRLFDVALPLARAARISRRAAHGILLRLDAPRYWQQTASGWELPLSESRLRRARIVRLAQGERLQAATGERPAKRPRAPKLLLILQGSALDEAGRLFQSANPMDLASPDVRLSAPKGALTVQPGADFLALLADAEAAPRRARESLPLGALIAEPPAAETLN